MALELRWRVSGQVQGVGFRPFVYRLAHEYGLTGWVQNQLGQVEILAQGSAPALQAFAAALCERAPPLAQPVVETLSSGPLSHSYHSFTILPSAAGDAPEIHVPPDYFTCADCLAELNQPADRRYRYPFINCTQCGPRYTLITRLPYDRPNTTLAAFPLCPACAQEYANPLDRRFHAQPLACPVCGPQLSWHSPTQPAHHDTPAALAACVAALRDGQIVAVKGIGGYHLLCDARDDAAIARLRARKARPHKPLAVLFPWLGTDGLSAVRARLQLTPDTAACLSSPQRPILLLPTLAHHDLSPLIAPGLREIGALLPYSPLHALLSQDFAAPLVATSANLSGEPVLTEAAEVEQRLAQLTPYFLHHNRPIQRPADDAVFRPNAGKNRPLRLGRGSAPLELTLAHRLPQPVLAVGGQMKNTVALAWEQRLVLSPHIGNLDSPRSLQVFAQVGADLQALYQVTAQTLLCDAHPGYASSRWAARQGLPVHKIWHHQAHASALVGEYPAVLGEWLVFTWDGVGLGEDGSLWGGEALYGHPGAWRRVARLRPFRLPGGERAGREPWRSALALCWESGQAPPAQAAHWPITDWALLEHAWQRGLNAPYSSAAGRLCDAAAALLGLVVETSFEGQGPMYLEAACCAPATGPRLKIREQQGLWEGDWAALLPFLQDEQHSLATRAAGFHASLAGLIADLTRQIHSQQPVAAVGLCGGVFQNRVLSELALTALSSAGFCAYLPQRLPANDAALSVGQVVEYSAAQR